jgi:type IV secretory pathway TrbF-like protein
MLVAMLLLLLFLAMATWWVYQSAQSIVDERHIEPASSAAPAPAAQQPATQQPATQQGAPANAP